MYKYKPQRDKIGQGAFGIVYKGFHAETKRTVAIKKIKKNQYLGAFRPNEINILIRLSAVENDHLVQLLAYDTTHDPNHAYLIMEYCSGGNLEAYLRHEGKLIEETVKYFMKQLADGMKTLQKSQIIHGDLKPANILLSYRDHEKYPAPAALTLKIGDFGHSRCLANGQKAMNPVGTFGYTSPEKLDPLQEYDIKSDLWSLGVMTFECLTSVLPFSMADLQATYSVLPSKLQANWSHALQYFLIGLLRRRPENRMNFKEFYNHRFLRGSWRVINESM